MKFARWASERCSACEMRACAHVKWHFRRSADVVSLCDGFEALGFCRFLLPYLAMGFHTFHFKIATAALRPRNDTKSERFYWEIKRLVSYLSVISHFRSTWTSRFPARPTNLVIARRAQFCARRGNLKVEVQHSGTKHTNTRRDEQYRARRIYAIRYLDRSSRFIFEFCFVLLFHISFRDAVSFRQRLPRPPCGLAMTQNWGVFVWKTDTFGHIRSFSFRNQHFFVKTYRFSQLKCLNLSQSGTAMIHFSVFTLLESAVSRGRKQASRGQRPHFPFFVLRWGTGSRG